MSRMMMAFVMFFLAGGTLFAQPAASDLKSEAAELKAYLMKQPIQRDILLGEGNDNLLIGCSVYTAPAPKEELNYKVMERLVSILERMPVTDVSIPYDLERWRIHLGWAYENCVDGPAPFVGGEDHYTEPLSVTPNTLGLQKAFLLYLAANHAPGMVRVAVRIAEQYEELFLPQRDEKILSVAAAWRSVAGISKEEISKLHRQLKDRARRPQPSSEQQGKVIA